MKSQTGQLKKLKEGLSGLDVQLKENDQLLADKKFQIEKNKELLEELKGQLEDGRGKKNAQAKLIKEHTDFLKGQDHQIAEERREYKEVRDELFRKKIRLDDLKNQKENFMFLILTLIILVSLQEKNQLN